MQAWMTAATRRVLAGIAADTTLSPVQRVQWATFIVLMRSDTWDSGLLSDVAISFGAPYAGVMA